MQIFNTLSGRKEDFVPLSGKRVRMYVCGVTPYSAAHVGHAMTFINFDMVRRYLEFRGYDVQYVQNFTDIDDKIIDRANRTGVQADALAQRHIDEFFTEMDALNIKRATVYPRATAELEQILAMIVGLIEKGFAYPSKGDVYYRVRHFKRYGQLSHRTLDGMQPGARIEVGVQKEDPLDFALWKAAKEGEPSWPSPWGPGRPGWHIECSAMNLHHLGERVDIHGGGADLIFPHHENEIAQSEAFTEQHPFSKIWMHGGLLQLGEEKMSKSLGNLVTVKAALQKWNSDAMRLFVLGSYYRNPLKFSEESLEGALRGAQRLRTAAAATPGAGNPVDSTPFRARFTEAMDDDFNSAQGIATLFDLSREINRGSEEHRDIAAAQQTLRELAAVLGLTLSEKANNAADIGPFVELLIETRAELRKAKQFALADTLRKKLTDLGVTLEDTAQGTRWRSGS